MWARGTSDAVFAARSDFAKAFIFNGAASTIPYAHREWVMLPEGEVVTIDRLQTADAAHFAYFNFHTNTGGTLVLANGIATGTVGGSTLAIHEVSLSGGTPSIVKPPVGTCTLTCNSPCGLCDAARFAVDDYTVKIPGPSVLAIHVIDGLASGEAPATVGSLNDDTYDPGAQAERGGDRRRGLSRRKAELRRRVERADGRFGRQLELRVPGASAARHVVFDAPEDAERIFVGGGDGAERPLRDHHHRRRRLYRPPAHVPGGQRRRRLHRHRQHAGAFRLAAPRRRSRRRNHDQCRRRQHGRHR